MPFELEEFVPDHNRSDKTDILLDVAQQFLVEDIADISTDFASLKNPDEFPIDFKPLMETTYDYRTPQIRDQDEEMVRRQYRRLFDWVRIKTTTTAIRSYLFSIGFDVDTFPMVSTDYETFRPVNDEEGLAESNEFFTPHVLIDLFQLSVIDGDFLSQEEFEIVQQRLEQIYGAWVVPHYRFNARGYAEEFHNVLTRSSVEGVSLNDFQINNSADCGFCFESGQGVQSRRTYQYMYTEFTAKVEVGTFDGTVDQNVTSLDSVLFTETDVEVELRQANDLTKIRADIYDQNDDQLTGDNWNAVLFYDDTDEPILLFKYPELTFLDGTFVEFRTDNIVLKTPPEIIPAELNEQEEFGENENVKTWLLNDYDLNYSETNQSDQTVLADSGFVSDTDYSVPFLTTIGRFDTITDRGYWRAGNLDGTTSGSSPSLNSGDLWNPISDPCHDYEIEFVDGANYVEFRAPLHKDSELFGETIEQLGIYENDGTLIAVSEFPDLAITVDDYDDRVQFRMRLQLPQNYPIFS
jgi:hypothetical protein